MYITIYIYIYDLYIYINKYIYTYTICIYIYMQFNNKPVITIIHSIYSRLKNNSIYLH